MLSPFLFILQTCKAQILIFLSFTVLSTKDSMKHDPIFCFQGSNNYNYINTSLIVQWCRFSDVCFIVIFDIEKILSSTEYVICFSKRILAFSNLIIALQILLSFK